MGTTASRDTQRRISFDNNFVVSPSLVPKYIDNDGILELENLAKDADDDLMLKDSIIVPFESQEGINDDYWAVRVDNLKKEHQTINKIIETEYEKTVESTKKLYESPNYKHYRVQQVKPCFDWRPKIMKCYEDNPHQPLLCSAVVQAFSQCVKSCRIED